MATIKIDRLEDVQVGDMVTLRVRDVTITGPAHRYAAASGGLYVYDGEWPVQADVFVSAEREVPDLPTKPGLYIAGNMADSVQNASILRRRGAGWENSDGKDVGETARGWADRAGGLVRLVPEGSETKKIADGLRRDSQARTEPVDPVVVRAFELDLADRIERGDWNE